MPFYKMVQIEAEHTNTTPMSMASGEETLNVAVIFGVTGLVGRELVKKLISKSSWKVYGVARNPEITPTIKSSCYQFISCDLLNPSETQKNLSSLQDVTHLFWVTWASQFPLDSKESCEQNKAMMANALNSILPVAKNLKHVSLQTGTKHYVSLQPPFANQEEQEELHYYNEESPRVTRGPNFYYALEDLLLERLNGKVSWSVHRPGLLLGSSVRSFYNFMGSLCVYGSICKHLNLPFVFGGTRMCWEETYIDGSDARLVADQHIWAATGCENFEPRLPTIAEMAIRQRLDGLVGESCNSIQGLTNYHVNHCSVVDCRQSRFTAISKAFNAINGLSFTWKEIWPVLGKKFGVEVPGEMFVENFWFSIAMADKKQVWEEIVVKNGLVLKKMEDLANWEFLDALFRCPLKLLGCREKVDRLGFVERYKTLDSILYWIDCMKDEKVIP